MEDGQHTRQFKYLCNKLGSSYAPVQHVLWFSFAVVEGQPYYSSGQQISQGKRKTNLLSCIFLIKGLHLPSPLFLWCIVGVSVESSHSSTPVLVLPVRRLEHQHPPPLHPTHHVEDHYLVNPSCVWHYSTLKWLAYVQPQPGFCDWSLTFGVLGRLGTVTGWVK